MASTFQLLNTNGVILRKILKDVHVVNVDVVHVNRYLGPQVAINDALHLSSVPVAVARQLKAQAPKRRHHGQANEGKVLLNNVLRVFANKDEKVENATGSLVGE